MNGLKRVRARHVDALTQVDWRQLEVLLAVYYRGQGYKVEHVGTGATGGRSDGGIDLKLRRDDDYVLVQVKHWNAYQVPHNDVHQLLGLMVNEGATGAVLVTSGEFTKAAIEAAARQGHVQLIDGEELRALLGPLPAPDARKPGKPGKATHHDGNQYLVSRRGELYERTEAFARVAGERLLDAAEDRIRYGRKGRSRVQATAMSGLQLTMLKGALIIGIGFVMWTALQSALRALQPAAVSRPAVTPSSVPAAGLPIPLGAGQPMPAVELQAAPAMEPQHLQPSAPTEAEIRESQRKAAEAMRVIEATTPEI